MGRIHDAMNKAAADRDQSRSAAGSDAGASTNEVAGARSSWRVDERLIAFTAPQDARSEEFRRLRTALQRMNPAAQVVVFAGIDGSEQSALLTANTAAAYAEGGGVRVLVIDADLRNAHLAAMLAGHESPGTAEALSAAFDRSAVQASGVSGVDLLAAGGAARNQSGVVRTSAVAALYAEARRNWDVVLVAAPALDSSADAEILGSAADGFVLVVEVGRGSRNHAQQCIERLGRSGVRVLGAVTVASSV